MSSSSEVGLLLAPDAEWLGLLRPLIRDGVDYFAVTPETLWASHEGELVANAFHAEFLALKRRTGRAFVAHSVGWSPGGASPDRRARWSRRMALDHAQFEFGWWTDHLGIAEVDGEVLALPLPLPHTAEAAQIVRDSLASAAAVVPVVGLENSAFYFTVDDPLGEPAFLEDCLGPDGRLLLDLHNLACNAANLGFDAREWLARADLSRVIEVHVSGGGRVPDAWSEGLWLDGHDTAVPEIVWDLLDEVVPHCLGLRGVTLERFEGTVGPADVPLLRGELDRIRMALS